jgi:hypothetical protein
MFWGTDDYPYLENRIQWETIIPTYRDFARRLGLRFNTVKTNISRIQDETRISHDFHAFLYNGTFRMRLLHSFVLLPLTAPLSIGKFDRLLIAASGRTISLEEELDRGHPPAPMRPETDEKIVWADLRVKYDAGIDRRPKIRGAIKDYLQKEDLQLKTCLRKLERAKLTDNTCVKCVNCILLLILEGIDPNRCGFKVDASTWEHFKHYFEKDLNQDTAVSAQFFSELQESIPDRIDYDFYGSRAFFLWFKTFNLASQEKNVWFYREIYLQLPYSIARILDKLYMLMNIRIHDQGPLIRQTKPST